MIANNQRLGSPAEYRRKVIFATRFLKGSNRSPGLMELDGQAITTEERVQAVRLNGYRKAEVSG